MDTDPLTREILELNEKLELEDEREPVPILLDKNRKKQKDYFDKRRRKPIEFSEGNLVMVRSEAPATGQSRKLEPKYKGPYEVVKALGNDRYLIQNIEGEQQSDRLYKAIIAVDKMKLIGKHN